jgi:hypothetical protein
VHVDRRGQPPRRVPPAAFRILWTAQLVSVFGDFLALVGLSA